MTVEELDELGERPPRRSAKSPIFGEDGPPGSVQSCGEQFATDTEKDAWHPQISKAFLRQATAFGSMTDGTTQRPSLPPDDRRLLVASLGVLAAVFALVASNVAANHSPKPHSLPIGMVGTRAVVEAGRLTVLASGPSRIIIEGGTHNTAAPPFDFLARAFLPLVERMGPKVRLQFERYGFYPAGGGRFCAEIEPCGALQPLHVGERVLAIGGA